MNTKGFKVYPYEQCYMASIFENEKPPLVTEEDFLGVDKPIPGQTFCCLSFLSPEKVMAKKEVFMTKRFLKYLDLNVPEDIDKRYDDFLCTHETELNNEFSGVVDGLTSIRGLKVRGVYETRKEADVRAKVLQRLDRSHNVFVGQVGYWLPWDPNPDNVQESEYLEKGLNDLMKNYKSNEVQRDMFYAEQVREYKENKQNKDDSPDENVFDVSDETDEVKTDGVEEVKS